MKLIQLLISRKFKVSVNIRCFVNIVVKFIIGCIFKITSPIDLQNWRVSQAISRPCYIRYYTTLTFGSSFGGSKFPWEANVKFGAVLLKIF